MTTARQLPHSPSLVELTDHLRQHAHKVTGPRQAILSLLRQQIRPLTSREVFDGLSAGECDLATVYRSLHVLERLGLVERFTRHDRVARFRLLPAGETEHQHDLICTQCTRVVVIGECFPAELENRIAVENGFRSMSHHLEFFGVCPECQASGAATRQKPASRCPSQ
jgi:Fur family transcriptional regulator, ferric uptake regulator